MTNELATKRAPKKGTLAAQLGGLAMLVGAFLILASGTTSGLSVILFAGGLVAVVVGLVKRNNDRS